MHTEQNTEETHRHVSALTPDAGTMPTDDAPRPS